MLLKGLAWFGMEQYIYFKQPSYDEGRRIKGWTTDPLIRRKFHDRLLQLIVKLNQFRSIERVPWFSVYLYTVQTKSGARLAKYLRFLCKNSVSKTTVRWNNKFLDEPGFVWMQGCACPLRIHLLEPITIHNIHSLQFRCKTISSLREMRWQKRNTTGLFSLRWTLYVFLIFLSPVVLLLSEIDK